MWLSAGASELLRALRTSPPVTRARVGENTGWSRGTVNARIDELLDTGLLREIGLVGGARGRPATLFAFDPQFGELLVADVGATSAQLARCELDGRVVERRAESLDIADGPDAVLTLLGRVLHGLRGERPLFGVAVGLPGPVQYPTGRVVSPPIMTGWDGFVVPAWLRDTFGVPAVAENDANAMAWGERCLGSPAADDLLFVKVGTGVGVGIVANGQILRGAQGAAGDLGHTWVDSPDGRPPPLCRCGKTGCLEAHAGGWAIARNLTAGGVAASAVADVVDLLRAGNPHAIQQVRVAGQVLGVGLAHAVSLLNPSQIVVGGPLSVAGEHLMSGIRQHVAARSLPLATRDLHLRTAARPRDVGLRGLADALAARVFRPDLLPSVLEALPGAPRLRA